MRVRDTFEIKDPYQTGHPAGLVVVLDTLLDPLTLVGHIASIRTPGGDMLRLLIDGAREHGSVSSLFFRNLATNAIAPGSEITVVAAEEQLIKHPATSSVS